MKIGTTQFARECKNRKKTVSNWHVWEKISMLKQLFQISKLLSLCTDIYYMKYKEQQICEFIRWAGFYEVNSRLRLKGLLRKR